MPLTQPVDPASTVRWVSAIATWCAVVVALLKEDILRLWRRPRLVATIRLRPPDCTKTPLYIMKPVMGTTRSEAVAFDCYYLRLWIENRGKQRAERVQIYAAKLLKKHADGVFREVGTFLPMNLRWAHSPDPTKPPLIFEDINPQMGRHCDLGRITDPRAPIDRLPGVPPDKAILHLDLEIDPATGTNLISPDVYRLQLRIAAANARPTDKHLEITLRGDWFADQSRMFADGIGIRELN
jgi:hypothetical protein